MHKKLAADLTSLAHSILQMKNKDDVYALKGKAYEVYEKLAVLAYVEEYVNNTPNPEHTKEELLEKIENVVEEIEQVEEVEEKVEEPEVEAEIVKHNLEEFTEGEFKEELKAAVEVEVQEEPEEKEEEVTIAEESQEEVVEEITEEPEVEVKEEAQEELILDLVEEPKGEKIEKAVLSLEDELQDTIAVDVVADLFENTPKKSLNDKLHGDIQIGLNDRIAFVKNLFDGSQEDFNRVISQLNTIKSEKEAKKFINKMVKPDYNWSEKEEFEERFMTIVERKFA